MANDQAGRSRKAVPAPRTNPRINGSAGKQPLRKSRRKKKQLQRRLFLLLAVLAAAIGVFALIRFATRERPKEDVILSEDELEVSTLTLYRSGKLTVRSVESFGRSYYDKKELTNAIDEAIRSYNEPEKRISKDDFSIKDNVAVLKLTYKASTDYEAFNEHPLYYGTLAGALEAGYDLTPVLMATNRDDPSKILSKNDFEELGSHKMLYLAENLTVTGPYKVLYMTPNMEMTDKKTAAPTSRITDRAPAILIFK